MLILNIFIFALPMILIFGMTIFAIFKHYQYKKFNKWAKKALSEGLEFRGLSVKQIFDIIDSRQSVYTKVKIFQKYSRFKGENSNILDKSNNNHCYID